MWYPEHCPPEVKRRWQYTGLLLTGEELTEHLRREYVYFVSGGVLSAVPKGTREEQVNHYLPDWECEDLFSPDYRFQTPLTQLEIHCYDGYAWVIVCDPAFSQRLRQAVPQVQTQEQFYADWN